MSGALEAMGELCPMPLHLMALLGEPVDEQYISVFCDRYGTDWLGLLIDPQEAPLQFEAIWRHVHARERWELLELLVCEHWISTYPNQVASSLGSNMRLDKTLHTVRGSVAVALYGAAKSVNWREPLTFVRALRVAEAYLAAVVENSILTREESRPAFEGRLGVCRVLQSRYVDLPALVLSEAITNLENSISLGNVKPESYSYLGEALLRFYDATGDPHQLVKLINLQAKLPEEFDSPTLRATIAEAWLRLSDRTSTRRQEYVAAAADTATALMAEADALVHVRAALIVAIARTKSKYRDALPVRGLRLPFGLKRGLRDWSDEHPQWASEVGKNVVTVLAESPAWLQRDPIWRRIDASARSTLGEILPDGTPAKLRAAWIESAVEKRSAGPGRPRLADPESGLENVLDLFHLHSLDPTDEVALVGAIEAALLLADFDQAWPTPMIVLAREVAQWNRPLSAPAVYRLRQSEIRDGNILRCVIASDASGLYEVAAKRALASREIDRKHIGGRTGVFLAEDYSGVVQDMFVFKPTTVALADREDRRAEAIARVVEREGLQVRFQVPQTMARSALPSEDPLRGGGYEEIVARQYHSGEILNDYVGQRRGEEAGLDALRRAVKFLALIHAAESDQANVGCKMRSQLWSREFGRWLKALRIDDRESFFENWWRVVSQRVPCFARRDAHPLNWIVTPKRNIIALDFEATGWRPAGYELAQLTDDSPLISVDDDGWKVRRSLAADYQDRLKAGDIDVDFTDLWEAYEASLIARATRLITDPIPSQFGRDHGVDLLTHLRENAQHSETRLIASRLYESWLVRLGVVTASDLTESPISDARRRHLSRALAYELRHGQRVAVDSHGWAHAADLADALNANGLRTTSAELQTVASAIDEPRFEVRAGQVRARYGHTRDVRIEYVPHSSGIKLFHGTAVANLNTILCEQGLLPMGRLWVHLSSDAGAAIRTAKRHGPSVLLEVDSAMVPTDVFAAGGSVFLTKEVPAHALRIVTPTELFLMGNSFGSI